MILSFKSKALKLLWEKNDYSKIQSTQVRKISIVLQTLNVATKIEDLKRPSFRFHELKGGLKGRFSIWINGNWRITFEFNNGNAEVLDYEDYH